MDNTINNGGTPPQTGTGYQVQDVNPNADSLTEALGISEARRSELTGDVMESFKSKPNMKISTRWKEVTAQARNANETAWIIFLLTKLQNDPVANFLRGLLR